MFGQIQEIGATGSGVDGNTRAKLLSLQRMEATEAEVYRRLAKMQPDPVNQSILNGIALEEERHESVIAKMTGEQVKADASKVRRQVILAKLFGFTFSVKMMEATEQDAAAEYRELGLYEIAEEEEAHEQNMIGMLDEERLRVDWGSRRSHLRFAEPAAGRARGAGHRHRCRVQHGSVRVPVLTRGEESGVCGQGRVLHLAVISCYRISSGRALLGLPS